MRERITDGPATGSAAGTDTAPSDSRGPDPRRWKALAICLIGGFMVLLDVSIVNVALPALREGLHASPSALQWVVSGYALTFGMLLVPSGRLGDVRGRRGMFVVALALFTATSLACGAALNTSWLIVARLAQGLAGGTLMPQITALIQELFVGKERGKAFGIFGGVVGVSTAIGPLLGGVLISFFGESEGWRAVFLVNIPVGLAAMPIAWRLLPKPGKNRGITHDYDPIGVVLIGLAAVLLLLPFVQERTWNTPFTWLLVPLAISVGGAFVAWEHHYSRRGHEPVVDLRLFRIPSYTFGSSIMLLYFAGFTPLFFVFSLYLQIGLHYTPLQAGLAMMTFAVGSAAAAPVGGRVVHRFGRPLIAVGLATVLIGFGATMLAAHLVPQHGTGWATALPLFLSGLGSGLVISPNQAVTLSEVPVRRAGTAGGVLQTGQRVGAAVGIAAVGAVFFAVEAVSKNYAAAFQGGLLVGIVFVLAALVLAMIDVAVHRVQTQRRAA